VTHRTRIPSTGRNPDQLLAHMDQLRTADADYRGGRTWSMVYWANEAHEAFLKKAHNLYFSDNALNPIAFKSLKQMESEVVQMTADMLHGPDSAVGTMTSGGTESILVAMAAYRDRARRRWPWIRRPNVVLPETAHPAFDKAGHYFGIRMRRAAVLPTGQVDIRDMKRRIDRNTIALAASAPQYVTGTIDPIPELGALALSKRLPFHVDGCFGGFIQPWLEKLGVAMPPWDFRVPGVTSISADVHKYGYTAKGASVIVYRDMSYLRHQFFVQTGWSGGIYISPSMRGTRPGGPIAAAWASLQAMGEDGYLEIAKTAYDTAQHLRDGLNAIDGLRVLGLPHSIVAAYAASSDEVDLFVVADQLQERGWSVDRQSTPPSIHCSVNAANAPVVDEYLADVRDAVAHARAHPELSTEGDAAMYGMMAKVPIRGLVDHSVRKIMEQMYSPDGTMPDLGASEEIDGTLLKALDLFDRAKRAIPSRRGAGL